MRLTATLGVGLSFLCAAGCVKRPVDVEIVGELPAVEEVLARVRVAEAFVHSVQGEAKVKVKSASGTGSTSMLVAADETGRFHFEVLDFFGRPVSIVVSDGKVVRMLDVKENAFFSGPATAATLGRLLPVALDPPVLVAILLGRAPTLAEAEPSLRRDEQTGEYVIELRGKTSVQTLRVAAPRDRVAQFSVAGKSPMEAVWSDFRVQGGIDWPFRVALKLEAASTEAEIAYRDVSLNVVLEPDLFVLDVPPGATVKEL